MARMHHRNRTLWAQNGKVFLTNYAGDSGFASHAKIKHHRYIEEIMSRPKMSG
jgi:hypothetical protein